MALTGAQKATLMEIVGISQDEELDFYLLNVNSYQETRMATDIATWDALKDKHLRISGGKDGVDLDNDRKRAAIVQRLKTHLALTSGSSSGSTLSLERA